MSLHPEAIPPIPDQTAKVARRAFRKGNTYMQMRDILGTFFTDDQFMDMYSAEGQPAYAPWRLALVSVMQFAENLTDRQTADAVRARIDWKYALSLELTDEGFDFSVLSEFRQRLAEHTAGERLFNTMLEHFRQSGLLNNSKQRTDSTHVLASVRTLNRLELVGRTLQAALDDLAEVAPEWLQTWVAPVWFTRYRQPISDFRLPQKGSERDMLAVQIGWDGLQLLEKVYFDAETPSKIRTFTGVEILRQVWLQQYVLVDDVLRPRQREEMPAAARLIQSPFDVEARYSIKRSREWVGYKVHLSETCHDDAPHLITHVLTTQATEPDIEAVEPIHDHLNQRDLLPDEHLVDRGYTSAPMLYDSQRDFGVELVGPVVEKHAWQQATGYEMDAFTIDWQQRTVTCPQGHTSAPWTMRDHRRNHELTRVKFKRVECEPCPVHDLCTKHDRRTLSFHEQPVFEVVQQRKHDQHTDAFRQRYAKRAGIEGTISHSVFALDMRRSRYRGLDKTHLQFTLTAAAMNLTRVLNWYDEKPRSHTRRTRFGKLAA
jgi:transposase